MTNDNSNLLFHTELIICYKRDLNYNNKSFKLSFKRKGTANSLSQLKGITVNINQNFLLKYFYILFSIYHHL
mgnify:CR=1 FL=1